MDIFIRNVPQHASKRQLERFFGPPLEECGVHIFHAEKINNKPLAVLTILDVVGARRFLASYGVLPGLPSSVTATRKLYWNNRVVQCTKSRTDPTDLSVRSLAYEESQRAARAVTAASTQNAQQNSNITRFAISSFQVGVWDYQGTQLAFKQHFRDSRRASIAIGFKEAIVLLTGMSEKCRMDVGYENCDNIILGEYFDPTITFTLKTPPKLYQISEDAQGDDVVTAALRAMSLTSRKPDSRKTRLTSLSDDHAKVVGTCFVYRLTLSNRADLSTIRALLGRYPRMPPTFPGTHTPTILPFEPLENSFLRLTTDLTDTGRYGHLPFSLLYQLYRLARNGLLSPLAVRDLLPKVADLKLRCGPDATLSAIRRFYHEVPFPGPEVDHTMLSQTAMEQLLESSAAAYNQHQYNPEDPYQIVKRHTHINLIHKVIVTPTRTYFEGPEPEQTNRVLRKYPEHIDSFIRVVFQDEDGGSVRYDSRACQDLIFQERFKGVLNNGILITGRSFQFLGFSHSSLRAQSCWFMAPLIFDNRLSLPHHILAELGDFSRIRVPAKCAARIGQNFTDTNATVDLNQNNVGVLPMVLRNGRDFSDGVGTISEALLDRVHAVYGRRRLLKPTALQIRYKGYKGMVSLDLRLEGEFVMLRENMKKFDAHDDIRNLEICGAAFKPLPMILNRQLIKILEDLGIALEPFMELQTAAVNRLRRMTESATKSAAFLENNSDCTRATRIPTLIKHLNMIGLDYHQDQFLCKVVELAVVTNLREMKYRGRIRVDKGMTLYGIMDETGLLQEGEVLIITEQAPEGGKRVHVHERVVITRSPVMHPGDVQIATAVNIDESSPLWQLANVIVFSQHGQRDLPSQLSGGDLDGDLYNVIWDAALIPATISQAAEYPRKSAAELDREVTSRDMSDFFVLFMESDVLGMISNIHMQLADQRETGTFDSDCIKLAGMASTAVDFSKTGIPVNMKGECPKYDRCRPDFMAPSPYFVTSGQGHLELEEQNNEEDEAFEGLDAEYRPFRYYESKKILGHLYRAIDERQFLEKMQDDRRAITEGTLRASTSMLDIVLEYVKRQASQYGILYDHHRDLASDIRAGYEESLQNIIYANGPTTGVPLSEHEAFAGTILGGKNGAHGKALREQSKNMRERFENVVEYTGIRIVKGDEQIQGVSDMDLLYEDDLDRELEALPRAIACLAVAVEEPGTRDRQLGELRSFGYIAAGTCLRELERYMITTVGSRTLPRV